MLPPSIQARMPWDKSLIIRFVFLDLIHGIPERSIKWLEAHYDELGDDLRALLQTLKQYLAGEDLDVGESDTLRVFWLKYLEHVGQSRKIIVHGTLKLRDPEDRESSKWDSIAVLLGEQSTSSDPHVALTYRALEEWQQATKRGEMWPAIKDENITEMMDSWLNGTELVLDNSEKGCHAVAHGMITPKEMLRRWPKSVNHESNRPKAMRSALRRTRLRRLFPWIKIKSDDHRVVMAMATLGLPREAFSNPDCVAKTWPQFWQFLAIFG